MTEERIIAYLLEELPDAEAVQFEEDCFAQESWPDQCKIVEADLIDAYLRRELTEERRQRFEQNYLTTEARQERVLLAAALLRHVDEQQALSPEAYAEAAPQGSAAATYAGSVTRPSMFERWRAFWTNATWGLRAASALAVVLLIALILWLALLRQPAPRTFTTLALTVSTNANRGGAGTPESKVTLPLGTEALRLSLKLPQGAPATARYRVELLNRDGEVKPLEVSAQDAQSVSVDIPARQLARGLYALRLFAVGPDGSEQRINGSYFFGVE